MNTTSRPERRNNLGTHLKVMSCAIAMTLGIGALTTPPPARALTVHDPLHTIQTILSELKRAADTAKDYIVQGQQLTTVMDQYKDMMLQGAALSDSRFDSLKDTLRDLKAVYDEGKALAHSVKNIEEEFRNTYQGYEKYLEGFGEDIQKMPEFYKQWADNNFTSARLAMHAAGIQTSAFDDEEESLQKLVDRSATAEGRMQAIQAGNEISAQIVQQIQRLREMIATQITLQSNWIAQQTEREATANALQQALYAPHENSVSEGF